MTVWDMAEWAGTGTGLLCVWLTARRNIWGWPLGIVSVVCYFFVFLHAKLYADTALHIIYLVLTVYGWWHWLRNRTADHMEIIPTWAGKRHQLVLAGLTAIVFILSGMFLESQTDTDVPYLDALTTALSLAAQWLMAKKHVECWLWWIVADLLAAGVYLYKELYLTAGFFIVLCLMAYYGFLEWKNKSVTAA